MALRGYPYTEGNTFINWAPPSEFVSSSIPSWQILTAHAQPFRGAGDLAFCLKVPLDSLLVWASSEGSGETARMRRLAWTFAARIGDKYQIRLARPNLYMNRVMRKVVVVELVFYGPSTLLRSFRAGQLNYPHCSRASILGSLPVLSAHYFASNWQLPFLNQRKGENGRRNIFMTKYFYGHCSPSVDSRRAVILRSRIHSHLVGVRCAVFYLKLSRLWWALVVCLCDK